MYIKLFLRCELSSQREQLEQHYAESNRTALNKMADLKNAALRDFKSNWNTEKEELLQRVSYTCTLSYYS